LPRVRTGIGRGEISKMTIAKRDMPRFNAVFAISITLTAAIGSWGLIDAESMTGVFGGFTHYMLRSISWYWLLITTGLVLLSGYMIFGPYKHIRLGADDERPEFSTASWLAMLFAAGMGAGLLFWGVAEPISHFNAPPGMEGGTPEAARKAIAITNFHWGLHAWAIYCICALVIAYFAYRRGMGSMISTPIKVLFHDRDSKALCTAADVLGVISVVFGLAGSLTMGIFQVRGGLNAVYGLEQTTTLSMAILGILFFCYMLSASSGLNKGIKILSDINMLLAILLLIFVMAFGPTRFIMETFINSIGGYLSELPQMSFKLFPFEGLSDWTSGWTLTYLIWWLAWGPFVGIFIARISRGRTIREFCIGVIGMPTLFSMLWFSAFGGSGIYIELFGAGGVSDLVSEDVTRALFAFLDFFPMGTVLGTVALALVFIFLVTSADSGIFVLSMMTTEGRPNPPLMQKMIWGTIVAVITVGTAVSGSVPVARAMAVTGALPFSVILLLQIVGFLREIKRDLKEGQASAEAAKLIAQRAGGSSDA